MKIKENQIKNNRRKIAGNSGYGYLNCYNGQWKDGNDYVHELKDMDERYLNNCLRELNKATRLIHLKFENISEIVELLDYYNLTEEDRLEIVYIGKCWLEKLFDEKIDEIEEELNAR
jgi:hypothetical protein